ncbi:MAG TPA: hypothetical protein VIV66_05540, partial [Pyrinomonadaceae bacterium]
QVYAYTAGAHQHYGLYADADKWARRTIEFGTKHKVPFAQAIGYEFLGEDAVHSGNFEAGLEYAAHESEIAEKLHSRERRAWTHLYAGLCSVSLGQLQRAEQEFADGLAIAEAVGENRVKSLIKPNFAVLQALLGRLDEALKMASENLAAVSATLIYSRFEALRCLAEVRLRRGLAIASDEINQHAVQLLTKAESIRGEEMVDTELDEAERLCDEAHNLVSPTESRVSQLWLGPLHIQVLIAQGKRSEAITLLGPYQKLVANCQAPRFTAEAARLSYILN